MRSVQTHTNTFNLSYHSGGLCQDPLAGIIPRSLHQLFEHLEGQVRNLSPHIQCTMMGSVYSTQCINIDFNIHVFVHLYVCTCTCAVQKSEFTVRVSFLELYNEELFDLLSTTDHSATKLRIYEDAARKACTVIFQFTLNISSPL